MLEIDRNAVAHHGLDLAGAPIGLAGVADTHAWFDDRGHWPGAKMVEGFQRIPSALMTQGMPVPMPAEAPPSDLNLVRLVGLRLCHDLGGVAGTIGNALEMLDSAGAEAAALAQDAAAVLRRRLLLWRALLGGQGEAPVATLLGLVEGQLAGGRASAEAPRIDGAALVPDAMVPVILAALVLGGEALPRGGVVRLAGDPRHELAVLPDGPRAAWPAALLRVVAGAAPAGEVAGRDVMALWLSMVAAAAGVRLGLALPPGGGVGPLVLTLPR